MLEEILKSTKTKIIVGLISAAGILSLPGCVMKESVVKKIDSAKDRVTYEIKSPDCCSEIKCDELSFCREEVDIFQGLPLRPDSYVITCCCEPVYSPKDSPDGNYCRINDEHLKIWR